MLSCRIVTVILFFFVMTNFPTNRYRSILQVIIIYYRCFLACSKITFDIKGHFWLLWTIYSLQAERTVFIIHLSPGPLGSKMPRPGFAIRHCVTLTDNCAVVRLGSQTNWTPDLRKGKDVHVRPFACTCHIVDVHIHAAVGKWLMRYRYCIYTVC